MVSEQEALYRTGSESRLGTAFMEKLTMRLAPDLPSFDSIPKTVQPITRPHAVTHHVFMYNRVQYAAVNILYSIISFKLQ